MVSAIFLVIAPGFVAGLTPFWISRWRMEPSFLDIPAIRIAGVLLIAVGSVGLLDSFLRFALQGVGTPAPVFPTRHLVVTGLYRYVRNPMYVGFAVGWIGLWIVFGHANLLAIAAVAAVSLGVHLFVVLYEEPTLRRKFGAEYEVYCRNVSRWWPHLKGWDMPE